MKGGFCDMANLKWLKIGGIACTVLGLIAGAAGGILSTKQQNIEIKNAVAAEVTKQIGNK